MNGLGPLLPLARNTQHGLYALATTYKQEINQNFKNLLLTSPGEKIMNPDFGVGIRRYLFEPGEQVISSLNERVYSQVNKYMPFINIKSISFTPDSDFSNEASVLSVRIEYEVPSLNIDSTINLSNEV
jgi:phage baseplate assembly protein W